MSFSLYLHYPFCRNRCSYCGFFHEPYDKETEREFFGALLIETELAAEQYMPAEGEIESIYIGGGTPSLASPGWFERWLDRVHSLFSVRADIEMSFECNPEDSSLELLKALKRIGVTRPTFGVQTFDRKLLRTFGREHTATDSHRSAYLGHALGFKTFGVDFLFGLPSHGSKELSKDLDELVDLAPPHISFYPLTVADGTEFQGKVSSGVMKMPDESQSLALYRGGLEFFLSQGYERYEVCSFARPGHECKHDLAYWLGADYLGLGPSAHSFMLTQHSVNVPDVREYITALTKRVRPLMKDESGVEQRMIETIRYGLRTRDGIDRAKFASRFGQPLEERLVRDQYDLFVQSGHLIPDRGSIRLSDDGLLVADRIAERLVK
ncbi:MAG: radical SAM family heme chaperone HemW [Candidatus Zixiibacteriota bacterium]|nr:MAG: radical SAM family heme chaperone HemW [candidate division Zixibacteria bacterium]